MSDNIEKGTASVLAASAAPVETAGAGSRYDEVPFQPSPPKVPKLHIGLQAEAAEFHPQDFGLYQNLVPPSEDFPNYHGIDIDWESFAHVDISDETLMMPTSWVERLRNAQRHASRERGQQAGPTSFTVFDYVVKLESEINH